MHFAFMPYGIKNHVDFIMEDINHKYLPLRLYKDGEEDKFIMIQVQLRVLPFGVYEIVFPKEFKNEILSALHAREDGEYKQRLNKSIMGLKPMDLLRKALKLQPVEYEEVNNFSNFLLPEYFKFVSIIPIGLREDEEFTEPEGTPFEKWTHEAI